MTSRSEPREQFEATLSALTESQRREVRLLARPFEWTYLEVVGMEVYGTCRNSRVDIVAMGTNDPHAHCTACVASDCVHTMALQTLYYGGHPMKTITDRQGDDR